MLTKITSKNQITLPKSVTQEITAASGPVEYFEVEARGGQIVLTPVRIQRGDAVRAKLAELALSDADVQAARTWARAAARSTVPRPVQVPDATPPAARGASSRKKT